MFLPASGELRGHPLVDADAAAENAHHFAGIFGGLWLAPFANFGVAKAIEGVNGVIDALGRTDDEDFEGMSVGV